MSCRTRSLHCLGRGAVTPKPQRPQEVPSPEPREQSHALPSQDSVLWVFLYFLEHFHSLCPTAQSCGPSRGWWDPAELPAGVPFPTAPLCVVRTNPPPRIHTQLPQKHRNYSQLNRVGALIAGNAPPTISSECTAGSNQAQPGGENGVPSPEVKLLPLGSNSTMEAAAFPIEPPQHSTQQRGTATSKASPVLTPRCPRAQPPLPRL